MTEPSSLQVLLHGDKIGSLNLLPGERILFVFADSYINNPNRSVLSLSFKDRLGELITETRPTRGRLPTYFSNLLPEGHLRDYLAARAGVKPTREFFLLNALGCDLSGAVSVEPMTGGVVPTKGGVGKGRGRKKALRFSLAGVQLKLSAVMESSGGLTIPADGAGGSWIVKLPSARFKNVPQNEYAMMTLARMIGMDIPEIRLVSLDKIVGLPEDLKIERGQALAVRRFDRSATGPVHAEDFAQVFGVYPEEKYQRGSYKNIAQVLWQESGEESVIELVRRLVFNTLIGNADMHLKNFSVIYPDGKSARLSPGYDFVSTISYIPDENMGLNYVKSKRMAELSRRVISYFAAKAGLPQKSLLDAAVDTVRRFREIWKREHKHLPVDSVIVKTIAKHVKTIAIWGEV